MSRYLSDWLYVTLPQRLVKEELRYTTLPERLVKEELRDGWRHRLPVQCGVAGNGRRTQGLPLHEDVALSGAHGQCG